MYRNEGQVGSAVQSFLSSPNNTSSLKREDIHFTSKLASNTSYEAARKSIKQSVKQSGLGYIDLFLLHSPYGGNSKRLECWKAVEDAIDDGEVVTGGVSNFGVKHVCLCFRPSVSYSSFILIYFSCKSFYPRNLECTQLSTRLRFTRSIRVQRSPHFARSTTSSSKHTLLWLELCE